MGGHACRVGHEHNKQSITLKQTYSSYTSHTEVLNEYCVLCFSPVNVHVVQA